ncbi:hypothetical protein PLICRDRAFT_534044 [Plicaturopsis crispa FD-325 SS-3]|nr:hypothetical protein PLICRDRAFT_534044 [Plicaturopsis crispa FD-325 SS-3]
MSARRPDSDQELYIHIEDETLLWSIGSQLEGRAYDAVPGAQGEFTVFGRPIQVPHGPGTFTLSIANSSAILVLTSHGDAEAPVSWEGRGSPPGGLQGRGWTGAYIIKS